MGAVFRKYAISCNFTFFSVQGVFLHQISPFWDCRLVIKLFCGSFNDFGEIPLLGPKTRKCVPKICHFLKFHIFSNARCVFLHKILSFLVCRLVIKLLSGSFIRISLGGGVKIGEIFLEKKKKKKKKKS